MIIVNADSIKKVRQMVETSSHLEEACEEVKKMLAVKRKMRSYSDYYPCCGNNRQDTFISLNSEIELLKEVLSSLEHNDKAQAIDLLKQYEHIAGVKYR
ncbi:MAG: hypothetical protein P8105_00385 [Dehalococcoidia bacterium]|jgi:hypothetical protein